tara:strand:- start:1557 stop:5726 length:4170 start_codon:yes stop_codon:yes gene_type:complete
MPSRSILSYYNKKQITTLAADASAGATSLTLANNGSNNMRVGQILLIESEYVTVTVIVDHNTLTVTRQTKGTGSEAHENGDVVYNAEIWQDVVIPGTTASAVQGLVLTDNLGSPKALKAQILNQTSNAYSGENGASSGPYSQTFGSFTAIRLRDDETKEIMFYGMVYDIVEEYQFGTGMMLQLRCNDFLQELRDNTTSGEFAFGVDTSLGLGDSAEINATSTPEQLVFTSSASTRGGLIKSLAASVTNPLDLTFSGDSNRFVESVRKFPSDFTYQLGERNKKSVLSHIRDLSNSDPTAAAGGNFGYDYYGDPNFTSTATSHKPSMFLNYFKRGNRPTTEPEKYGARLIQPYSGFNITGRSTPTASFSIDRPKDELYTDAKVTLSSHANRTDLTRPEKTIDFELIQISEYANVTLTTVNEAVDTSEVVITVTDASSGNTAGQAIIAGMTIQIDDEAMWVSSVSSNDLTVVRGVNYTTAVEHDNSTVIKSCFTWGNPDHQIDDNFFGTASAITAPEKLDAQLTQLNEALDATETDIIVDSNAGMYVNQILHVAPSATAAAREYLKVTAINANGTQITVERDGLVAGDTTGVTHVDNSYVFAYSVATMQYVSRVDTAGGSDITANAPAFVLLSSVLRGTAATAIPEATLTVGTVCRGHYNRNATFTILSRPKNTHKIRRTLSLVAPSQTTPFNIKEDIVAKLMKSTHEVVRGTVSTYEKPRFYVDAIPTAVGSSSSATVEGTTKHTETLTFGKVLVTTLAEALDDSETAIDVTSSDEMYIGQTFQIDSEKFEITAINSATNISADRGEASTSAAEHDDATQIYDISANPLNFGIRVGTTLSELDSNNVPTSTYGYASAVTATQVTGTWDTGQISTSSIVRYFIPIRAGDYVRYRNDLVSENKNYLITKAIYTEQTGISYTEYDIVSKEDSNADIPVQKLSQSAAIMDTIQSITNIPTTSEIQGVSTDQAGDTVNPVGIRTWTAPGLGNAQMYRLQADTTLAGVTYAKGTMIIHNPNSTGAYTLEVVIANDILGHPDGGTSLGDTIGSNFTFTNTEQVLFQSVNNAYEEYAAISAPFNYSSSDATSSPRYVLYLPTTAPSADSFLHTNSSGVMTFVAASSVGGASLSNDGNNRVVTATGSGGINGESTLTYDSTTLTSHNAGEGDTQGGSYYPSAVFSSETTTAGGAGIELFQNSSSPADNDNVGYVVFMGDADDGDKCEVAHIRAVHQDVSAGSRDGALYFRTTYNSGGTTANTDASLTAAGVWTDSSDEKFKIYEGTAHSIYGGTDGKVITDKVKSLNIGRYYGKDTPSDKIATSEKHISPTAQDFYDLFGTGTEKTGKGYTTTRVMKDVDGNVTGSKEEYNNAVLSPKDMSGVALMAIKELIARVEALES